MFEEQDIQNAVKRFDLELRNIIGKGGFGMVYRVYSKRYKQEFALKVMSSTNDMENEVQCLKSLDHPSVVNLYDYFKTDKLVMLLMEYCTGGSFDDYVKRNGPLTGEQLRKVSTEVLKPLAGCHKMHIAHRDIKPSNILLSANGRAKLCDFGLSDFIAEGGLETRITGSLAFVAPEAIAKKLYDPFKADIWALGVTFYIMTSGCLPWDTSNRIALIESIKCGSLELGKIVDHSFVPVIAALTRSDPKNRPTVDEVHQMPYFQRTQLPLLNQNNRPLRIGAPMMKSLNDITKKPIGTRRGSFSLNKNRVLISSSSGL